MELYHRTIVITGASKGLGKEMALRLSRSNSDIILVARTEKLLQQVQKEIEISTGKLPMIICCDVSNEQDVQKMAEIIKKHYRKIDVLVNNAGIGIHKNLEHMTYEEMRRQFETNVYGPWYCIKALLPSLQNSDSGYILNVSSLVSVISFADNSTYAATKGALSAFSNGLRAEMKPKKIQVGLLFPPLMDTSFQDDRTARLPFFMYAHPRKVARVAEKMIKKRKKKAYVYRWMLIPMKMRQVLG
jgi:short-subunit dehydrogenase